MWTYPLPTRGHSMEAIANKQIMHTIFDQLAHGNGKAFVDAFSEDIVWHIIGDTAWSGTYRGKEVVLNTLLRPLFGQFDTRYKNRASRMTAESDMVVVECQGEVMTKAGKAYNNTYCYVCRMSEGKICELAEYLDTKLINDVLLNPG